jgi:hypothetical protein
MKIELGKEYITNRDHEVKHMKGRELHLKIIALMDDPGEEAIFTAQQIHPNPLYNGCLWYVTKSGLCLRDSNSVIFKIQEVEP